MNQITENDVIDFFSDTIIFIKEQEVGKELFKCALTKSGTASRNLNLNGFIA